MFGVVKQFLIICLKCRKKKRMTKEETEKPWKCDCGSTNRSISDIDIQKGK